MKTMMEDEASALGSYWAAWSVRWRSTFIPYSLTKRGEGTNNFVKITPA